MSENPLLKKRVLESEPDYGFTATLTPAQQERKLYRRGTAIEAAGALKPGLIRHVVSKGQFSKIDFIRALIQQTGPCDAVISTWTAASHDISEAHAFLESEMLKSCRFIVDFTFQRRKPSFCAQLRSLFGDEAIRVTQCHMKFAVLTNADWAVVLSTSANLNMNPRWENYQVYEDRDTANWYLEWVNHLWKTIGNDQVANTKASQHRRRFQSQ